MPVLQRACLRITMRPIRQARSSQVRKRAQRCNCLSGKLQANRPAGSW